MIVGISMNVAYQISGLRTVALIGSGVLWTTVMRVNHLGNGRPSSRAKDQACRDAAAVELMAMPNETIIIGTVIPIAPAELPTALLKTAIHGYTAVESTICVGMSCMTKAYVIIATKPSRPLKAMVPNIIRGTVRDALLTYHVSKYAF